MINDKKMTNGGTITGSQRPTCPPPDILIPFHVVTCGQQGENLGRDEAPIVQISFIIFEVARSRILETKHFNVQPISPFFEHTTDSGLVPLTEEAQAECGLTNEMIEDIRFPLARVLADIDVFLTQRGFSPSQGKNVCLVTDGQLPLRMVLHPEAFANEIALQHYHFSYFDIRKEVQRTNALQDEFGSLDAVMDYLHLERNTGTEKSLRRCYNLAAVIRQLINCGHTWGQPEQIDRDYAPAVFKTTDPIDEDVAVKALGLPWSATVMDLRNFFRGLNIQPGGIALRLNEKGRRNGEAYVRFTDKAQRRMAEMRNRHHLGKRYVEVAPVESQEFMSIAGSDVEEGEIFLQNVTTSDQTVVRMRGLPYNSTIEDITQFFSPVNVDVQFGDQGILFVNHPDGRATGDAFVIFETANASERALERHKQHMGDRYVELFKSTPSEVNQVLRSVKSGEAERNKTAAQREAPNPMTGPVRLTAPLPGLAGMRQMMFGGQVPLPNGLMPRPGLATGFPANMAALNPLLLQRASQIAAGQFNIPTSGMPSPLFPQPMAPNGMGPKSMVIRGVPPETAVNDVRNFLGIHLSSVLPNGIQFVVNGQGRLTGCAIINMNSEPAALVAAQTLNGTVIDASASGKSAKVDVAYLGDLNGLRGGAGGALLAPRAALNPLSSNNPCLSYPVTAPLVLPSYPGGVMLPGNSQILPGNSQLLPGNSQLLSPTILNNLVGRLPTPTQQQHPLIQAYQYQMAAAMASSLGNSVSAPSPAMYAASLMSQISPANPPPPPPPPAQPAVQTTVPSAPNPGYYVQPNVVNMVIAKGLPKDAHYMEIVELFSRILLNGNIPDIQVSMLPDGTSTGDAYISFHSRTEAELAVTHCNQGRIRNHVISLQLAQPRVMATV